MLTITYLILSHGEESVFPLIDFLREHKAKDDKIKVLNDPIDKDYEVRLKAKVHTLNHILAGDYSEHRNWALKYIATDYVFALDADERPADELIDKIHVVLDAGQPDMVWVPRANYFEGVTPAHALQFGWTLSDGLVNWPDPQTRILRTGRGIRWVGRLHERLKVCPGQRVMRLPANQKCAIFHHKIVGKQIIDNQRYAQQFSAAENAGHATMEALW